MLRLHFSRDWKPYFQSTTSRVRKGKMETDMLVEDLTSIYAGRKFANHVARLGLPVLREKEIRMFNEMEFTLEELERKLPFLMIKLTGGEVSTVERLVEAYRQSGDASALLSLATLKREKYAYSTKAGEPAESTALNGSWFKLEGYSLRGQHGQNNGQYTNFDSFSIFKYASSKGEVLAINLQDGITHGGDGLTSSNNVNKLVREYNGRYAWEPVLDRVRAGRLDFDGYLAGLKNVMLNEAEDSIEATTLSVVILIHAKGKTYVLGNMIGGNSPVVKISEGGHTQVLSDDRFQMQVGGVLSLSDVAKHLDKRLIILTDAKKGDVIAVGSDGVVFMDNLLDMFKTNTAAPNDPKTLYEATKDDATMVRIEITE